MALRRGRQRDAVRENFRGRAIREQQGSGLAIRASCDREGVKDGAFLWFWKALGRRDREASATRRADRDGEPTEAAHDSAVTADLQFF
jgi:hypothetical protein